MITHAEQDEALSAALIEIVSAHGENAPSEQDKYEMVRDLRQSSDRAAARQIEQFLVCLASRWHQALVSSTEDKEKLRKIIDELTRFPWLPAIYLGMEATAAGPMALVMYDGRPRFVGITQDVDAASLAKGDIVYLSQEQNVVLAKASHDVLRVGDTAIFDRMMSDGRAVIRYRDEQVVADVADAIASEDFKNGDLVRWNRDVRMVLEKIEQSAGEQFFLEETPAETFGAVGGLASQVNAIRREILLHLNHPEMVRRYGLRRKGSILLVGPPGTGKTMLSRALANFIASLVPSRRCRFAHIKPGSMNSMWFGETERNYRDLFRVAREASQADASVPVVLFLDEVDSVGSVRGGMGSAESVGRVDDRVLTALMSELDGLESRSNILVVAATNRHDVLDPALLRPGRLGDCVIQVPRPNMSAAADIFARYLKPDIPYARNGHADDRPATRREIIESVVSRIYAPNGDGDLATITFRDGKHRPLRASDLISGAMIANICRSATEKACVREIETGESGLKLTDVLSATADEVDGVARTLSPWNCHKHLGDLPQDVPVASIEMTARKVRRPHRFIELT